MTDKNSPISPDTEQFIAEHPEAKVVHVPRIGEHPKSDETTAAPLQAREWLKESKQAEWFFTAYQLFDEPDKSHLAELLTSYSSHVNSGLLEDYKRLQGEFGKLREPLDAAEARISELERERDEARLSKEMVEAQLRGRAAFFSGQPRTMPYSLGKLNYAYCLGYDIAADSKLFNEMVARADNNAKRAELAESQLSTLREALSDIAENWKHITWTGVGNDFTGNADRCEIQEIERTLTPPTQPQGETK